MKSIYILYIFIFTVFVISSCHYDDDDIDETSILYQNYTKQGDSVNKNVKNDIKYNDTKATEFINKPCVCFFSMSQKEYDKFLLSSNINVKWEFDILSKKFKKISKNSISALKENNIYSILTYKPYIEFITNKKDTIYFNRKDEGYFIGQLFFSGKDTFQIEEGLLDENNLEEKIRSFFKLNDNFSIKSTYEQIDTTGNQIIDTLIPVIEDSIN